MANTEAAGLAKTNISRPLLSIIIPTYNRQECAASAIRCALAIPSNDIEVVVQDCSDNDLLSSIIAPERLDKRLSYRYERPAVMMENWNRAIGRATGEYICIIGDDDGVNPEIVQAAAWAKSNALDGLAVAVESHYLWPRSGVPSTAYSKFFNKALDGHLEISPFQGYITTDVDIEVELRKFVRDGGVYFQHFNLPKLYHGFVHRRCLDAVREKVGAYCVYLSPDIFLSLTIACTAPRLAVTDYPLTIPGASKASNSIIHSEDKKRQLKDLKVMPEFRNNGYNWSELVPHLYTVPPIWADSAIKALLAMGRANLVRQLNLPRLAAYCIRENRGVIRPVLQGLFTGLRINGKNSAIGAIMFAWNVLWMKSAKQAGWIKRVVRRIGVRRIHDIDGLNNMVEASQALTRYLNDNGWSFAQCAIKSNLRK
jgi:glycosyltransferase involved in cell wall biosynthesis